MSVSAIARRPGVSGRAGWVTAAVGVLAAFAVVGLISDAIAPTPQGPASSSYATTPAGVAAWAELLARAGHPVARLRRPVADVSLSARDTLVVLGATALPVADGRAIDRFVAAGGRLVLGGGDLAATLPRVVRDPPSPAGPPITLARARGALPELAGVQTVHAAGASSFIGPGAAPLLTGGGGGSLLAVRTLGAGRLDLLSDPSPLQNRLLGVADDAQLALDLAGGRARPVVFDEQIHGFAPANGLAALPERWWLALGGLALAGVAWALSRGRRLGPADPLRAAAAPPRAEYVEAMADVLARAGDERTLADLLTRARGGT